MSNNGRYELRVQFNNGDEVIHRRKQYDDLDLVWARINKPEVYRTILSAVIYDLVDGCAMQVLV